ncbi:hypothetical protein PAGU2196_46470 [Pseudomonas sp. PAGU 2196]|nr:hypothetical protein PAGU2196_46470 [Pseudomonas sp. PAGU 2196]
MAANPCALNNTANTSSGICNSFMEWSPCFRARCAVVPLSVDKNFYSSARDWRRYCSGVQWAWRWNMAMKAEPLL